jgi:basic membrane lipoprotein Med (substrate-binding protein (PBP1-ABC) superfamily)
MNKKIIGVGLAAVAVLSLAACGSRDKSTGSAKAKTDLTVAIITDTGGVDDKSFNQSSWEGLQAWGKLTIYLKIRVTRISNLLVNLTTQQILIVLYQVVTS